MATREKISSVFGDAFKEDLPGKRGTPVESGAKAPRGKQFAAKAGKAPVQIVGYPIVWPPLKWDDLGLGLVRSMGFVPNRAVQLEFRNGLWTLTGAQARSSIVLFLAAGAGGIIYFLQDILSQVKDWGWWASTLVFLLPILANLMVRMQSLEFQPYEIEMLGYDSHNHVLVVSTITQPGGVVALRVDLPQDERIRRAEEARIVSSLRQSHTGFTIIDGLAQPDYGRFRNWTLWALVWVLIYYFYFKFY